MVSDKICCICGVKFHGWGNNPQPIMTEGFCCDNCNMQYVIAARCFGIGSVTLPKKEENNGIQK